MKTTIDTLKRGGAVLGAFLCATMVQCAFSDEIVHKRDITQLVRDAGSGTYTVSLGEGTVQNDSYPASNAFDGVTAQGIDNRVLLSKSGSTRQIVYAISDTVLPHNDFQIDSLRVYRLNGGDSTDIPRSPTAFTLEGQEGDKWETLLAVDSQTWDSSTLYRDYEIPVANRGCYRKYRFSITAFSDQYWCGVQELVLYGDIMRSRLVWNGAEGAKWNATDANWLDRAGNVTNWMPGATAEFGASGSTSIVVEGTNEVGGIVFSQTNVCTIFGGALALAYPAVFRCGGGEVGGIVASEFVDAAPVDEYQGIVDGHENYFPADPSDTKQGAWTLLWRNRRLVGITNFTGAVINQGGEARPATPYHYMNDGETASVQFQCKPNAILCVKVLFAQIGADVYGRVAYVKFTWMQLDLGTDFDGPIADYRAIQVYDNNVVTSMAGSQAYGFYGIVPHGGEWGKIPLAVTASHNSLGPAPDGGSFLPRSASNPATGSAVLCFPGCRVADLSVISEADLYYTNIKVPSSIHHFVNNVTNATVQIQGNTGGVDGNGARLCVKVEFTDGEGGVYARAVYARFDWGNTYAHDFDASTTAGAQPIYAAGTANSGYGVKSIVAVFKGERVTFGAPALTFDRDITGDGTVRFAPLSSSQTVSVTGTRSLDKVAFGGATSFTFAEGASLSVGSAEIEDAAAVSVVGKSGANLLRIGTSKCLAPAACAHFTVNGGEARQDALGWIVPKPGLKIIIR